MSTFLSKGSLSNLLIATTSILRPRLAFSLDLFLIAITPSSPDSWLIFFCKKLPLPFIIILVSIDIHLFWGLGVFCGFWEKNFWHWQIPDVLNHYNTTDSGFCVIYMVVRFDSIIDSNPYQEVRLHQLKKLTT